MDEWLRQWPGFLFGTPRRTLTTLGVLLVLFLVIRPEYGEALVNRLMNALTPIFSMVFVGAVCWWLIKKVFLSSGGKKK